MDIEEFFESMPFARLLGVEVTEVADGHAEGRVEMREELSWNADRVMAHGGVTFTLADTVGGAALVSLVDRPCRPSICESRTSKPGQRGPPTGSGRGSSRW